MYKISKNNTEKETEEVLILSLKLIHLIIFL